ncbi:Hypothetical predicted protein [Octopus vulgaris]|uniref:Uncharacterized protein n=1 Tax=Octopus vulgaris TaxID=6645 RepID=A0AA36AZB2_OCTVU|nr:Hypothetical predicted protein [Octopus vulgaris]
MPRNVLIISQASQKASQMEKPGTQGNDDTCPASNTTTEDQRGAMAARKERHPGIDGKQEVAVIASRSEGNHSSHTGMLTIG